MLDITGWVKKPRACRMKYIVVQMLAGNPEMLDPKYDFKAAMAQAQGNRFWRDFMLSLFDENYF